MTIPWSYPVQPTPECAKKLIYKKDLQAAVQRLDTCWSTTQLQDILNSVRFFADKMEKIC